MTFLKRFRPEQKRKTAPATKERTAIADMEAKANAIRNKAFDDYLEGRITKSKRDAEFRRSEKVRRGF